MALPVHLRVLVENTTSSKTLLAEHGLSLWIEVDGRRILFDTGQGPAFSHNVEALGVDLSTATDIVLSHGHYDHGGGLGYALGINSGARVYAHPACTIQRFSRKRSGPARSIGLESSVVDTLYECAIWSPAPVRLSDSVLLTGTIPRTWYVEKPHDTLCIDRQCTCVDPVVDDQALVVTVGEERLVVLGCAHAGVVNTVTYALQLFPGKGPVTVLGGMHLGAVSGVRIRATADALLERGVSRIICGHCTGDEATAVLQSVFGDRCSVLSTGSSYRFG